MINWPTDEQVNDHRNKNNCTYTESDKLLKKESLHRTISCANSVNDLKEVLRFIVDVI